MKSDQRQAVLLALIQRLRKKGSWCGETHIQKSAYFLQELLGVPLELNVVFYKHGPYSFDLSDVITSLRGDELLTVIPRGSYGPTLLPTENVQKLLARFPITMKKYSPAIRFVSDRLGPKNVAELERLSTALYVIGELPNSSMDRRAREINRLKPHVSIDDATAALQAVESMRAEIDSLSAE
jgi:uncharacterized protein YwgA